jgi:hypothetical protein
MNPQDQIEAVMTEEELLAKIGDTIENSASLFGANVAALFSAHMESETIPFKIGECAQESSVTLQPMDGDKLATYRDNVSKFSTEEGTSTKFYFEPNTADSEVALLLGTVKGGEFYFNKPVPTGGFVVEKFPFPPAGPNREKFFRMLTPELRALLVKECKRVNGLHPAVPK